MRLKRWMSTDVSQEAVNPPFSARQMQVQGGSLQALLCQPRRDTGAGNTHAIAEGTFEDQFLCNQSSDRHDNFWLTHADL
jgi:hypothetical protein